VPFTHKERQAARAHQSRRQGRPPASPSWLQRPDDIRLDGNVETWLECRRCHRVWRADGCILGVLHGYVDRCTHCEVSDMQTTGTFPALSQPRPPKKKTGTKKR
jgi:hypothetical protein